MERYPLYHQQGKKISALDFFRNFRCPNYDKCLDKAAHEDLFLDCGQCLFKDTAVDLFILNWTQ